MERKSRDLSFQKLAAMSRAELNTLWEEIKTELEAKDPDSLTDDEKNYLILALFYTSKA
jgi:hypothetical protein